MPLSILHEVDRWGGTTLAVAEGAAAALGSMRDRVVVSSLMEEAIATSQLEGAATTRKVAKEMLRTNRKPRTRGEKMIVNSYRTIQLLSQRLDEPLTVEFLFDIQESMTRDTLDDPTGAGRFRTAGDEVAQFLQGTTGYAERCLELVDCLGSPLRQRHLNAAVGVNFSLRRCLNG